MEDEKFLIVPELRESWRPVFALVPLGVLAAVACLPDALGGSSGAMIAAPLFMIATMATSLARKTFWATGKGTVRVTYNQHGLICRRGEAVLGFYPWATIQCVDIAEGDRFPEWSRWASFACVRMLRVTESGTKIEDTPAFLLVHPRRIRAARGRLLSVARDFIGSEAH